MTRKLLLLLGAVAFLGAPVCADTNFTVAHQYNFGGTLSDSVGGLTLNADGAADANGNFGVPTGGGMNGYWLGGALDSLTTWQIDLTFSLNSAESWDNWNPLSDSDDGYSKIIDFTGFDSGLYVANGQFDFFANGSDNFFGSVSDNTPVDLMIKRDAGTIYAYVNGALAFTYADTSGAGIFAGNSIHFFEDDIQTGRTESGPGTLSSLTVYNDPPTEQPVPEPATLLLLGTGLTALGGLMRRKISLS